MFKFEDYKLRNLWMASIMTLTEHSYEPLNVRITQKHKKLKISKISKIWKKLIKNHL